MFRPSLLHPTNLGHDAECKLAEGSKETIPARSSANGASRLVGYKSTAIAFAPQLQWRTKNCYLHLMSAQVRVSIRSRLRSSALISARSARHLAIGPTETSLQDKSTMPTSKHSPSWRMQRNESSCECKLHCVIGHVLRVLPIRMCKRCRSPATGDNSIMTRTV